MGCGDTASIGSLVARAIRTIDGTDCTVLACTIDVIASGLPPDCSSLSVHSDLAMLLTDSGLVRVEPMGPDTTSQMECDDHQTLLTRFHETLRSTDDGNRVIVTYSEGSLSDCSALSECDDTTTLAQMLRSAFIRVSSGELRVRTVEVSLSEAGLIECDPAPLETLMRSCMIEVAPREYAIKVAYL